MAPVSAVEPEAKLAFVEFLLTSVDVQESARRAVDWLVAHAPVTEAAKEKKKKTNRIPNKSLKKRNNELSLMNDI